MPTSLCGRQLVNLRAFCPFRAGQALTSRAGPISQPGHVKDTSRLCTKAFSLFSFISEDPGDWNHSPEWWGTQGGGWGRGPGTTVFSQESVLGNGQVTVTAHAASEQSPSASGNGSEDHPSYQEWRVLRFNDDTRQSVAKVAVTQRPDGGCTIAAQPDCLAFEYLKTMAAAAASVDAVDLDPAVVEAATSAMGLPKDRPNLRLHTEDAAAYMARAAAHVQGSGGSYLDAVLFDAFDGADNVPASLASSGVPFLDNLAAALHPDHGTVIMNLHGGGARTSPLTLLWKAAVASDPGPGYELTTPEGAAVDRTARLFRDAVCSTSKVPGSAYTLSVANQQNIIVVVSRAFQAATFESGADLRVQPAYGGAATGLCQDHRGTKAVLNFACLQEVAPGHGTA
ncbi:hypothetical protein WJX72_001506 [[Myrmecia] bisecta]|uniref:Uncharacterized protein n=1 Tax=[Myrmecia] bisecta TaxID=41462 RepID=A0AAW1PGM6_9CHLO